MLKQILSKLPRKSPKSDSVDGDSGANNNNNTNNNNSSSKFGSAFQCAIGASSLTSKLNVVKRVSSAVFPASITAAGADPVEPHLSFKDVPSSQQKQSLFVAKLNHCSDPAGDPDLRRDTLVELVDFVSSGSAKFTDPAIAAMCRMCSANLFRVFPPKHRSAVCGGGEADGEEEPMFDPSWSHIQLVYDLLLRFVSSASLDAKVAKKHLDHSFILRLLDLFESEDPRERDCLKTILHRIYGKFMAHRPFVRRAVSNIVYRFVFETERHNGMAELLEIFGSVISGFATPLKEEHKVFLWRALIPLHRPRSVGIYHQQLTYCVVQFVDKDPRLVGSVINGLLKYWPVTNSQKELMFLGELEEILEMITMAEFQKVMLPLFRRIARCLNSSHYQVAERAHLMWNNEIVLNLITQNRHAIVPVVVGALERNTRSHWNQAVLNLTLNVKKVFMEMDEELFLASQRDLDSAAAKSDAAAESRRLAWKSLESQLSDSKVNNGQPPCPAGPASNATGNFLVPVAC